MRGAPPGWAALACAAGGLLQACTPALDWRTVAVEPAALVALFPCRPDIETRTLELQAKPVEVTLRACRADGLLFALMSADLGDSPAVAPALADLEKSGLLHLDGLQREDLPPLTAEGAASGLVTTRTRLEGRAADGKPRYAQTAQFAAGTWMHQATVLGERPWEDASTQAFFASMRRQP